MVQPVEPDPEFFCNQHKEKVRRERDWKHAVCEKVLSESSESLQSLQHILLCQLDLRSFFSRFADKEMRMANI